MSNMEEIKKSTKRRKRMEVIQEDERSIHYTQREEGEEAE